MPQGKLNSILKLEFIRAIEQIAPNHIELLSERGIAKDILNSRGLTLISIDSWKKSEDSKSLWLSDQIK